ncbi:MAG: sensor histidine kinase [Butyrivibrio sp.]|uniref:cache domain-containing sensor histidine kinase n=1 Tax=Butyrivibrio sp. TaxID=28121 RepID=UPI001B2C55AE|nr:sensor histidine kinase [Butyrivibrio sp.]MBO6240830.1 sensor histidine kinase [Butyrivibrio sp.]
MTLKDMERQHSDRKLSGKDKARNMSIKYKIASMTVVVALIPIVLLTVLMLIFYNRAIMQRAEKQIEENIRIMSDRISSVLKNGELCSNNLTIEFSNFYNDRVMKQVTRDARITSQLSQSLLIYNGISSIVFMDADGRFYSSDPALESIKEEIKSSEYVASLNNMGGKTVMMDPTINIMNREDKEIVTMGKHVINIVTGSPIGYLFINMDKDYLIESSQSEISYYFLYDTNGNCISERLRTEPIYSDNDFLRGLFTGTAEVLKYDGETYLMAKDEIEEFKWTIVGITNLNRFNVTGRDLRFILLTTGSISAVLLLLSVIFSTNIITRPLKILHDGAEQIAEGDMSYRFRFKTRDEIGRLGRIFNYMTQRNLELIKQVDEEAKKKREYELSLIQEQVKPHFLYNTLDIIIMLIEMNRSKEAARVTQKLANYYKNSLSGSEEIVSIEREIQITRDYLNLQTMRYGDKFKYSFDIPASLYATSIPKMTLQPLIENAIYHGLKYKEDWGSIEISGERKDGLILLFVRDDGVGIDSDKLLSMQEKLKKNEIPEDAERKHFGVYSVDHRLRLYFGDEYGLNVDSIRGVGTTFTISIPDGNERGK